MSLVLDAGALIALERADRRVVARIKRERTLGRVPVSHGGVIGQVWRGEAGAQHHLARALDGVDVQPLDDDLGRRAGALLRRARTSDVIDAAVALLAAHGDEVLSSDPHDLALLLAAAGIDGDVVPVGAA